MVVQPHVAQPIATQGKRPEKFCGNDFKRWHQKMLFYLTTLNLARFLSEEASVVFEGETDTQKSSAKTARALSESLKKKYKIEDVGLKKFICATTTMEGFQNYLTHKRKEMGLDDLIVRLRIEGDNRLSEMKSGKLQIEAKANLMEQNGNTSTKRKCVYYKPKKGRAKMIKRNCYNCGKSNYMAKDCRLSKKNQVHVSEVSSVPIDLGELNLSVVVFEANFVDNTREWWIDTGATCHICSDKEMFSTYTNQWEEGFYRKLNNF
ncbi:UNVERIFIED_CONTAM: hypothetical protein Scaly_2834300 [Sesamum calycinum]|uniref:CCHC-type domain-containing protein n=1 Tax=Sesamum calycinum TaxID=2727403 RepID=A0AAW2IS75_9LAMI